MLDVWLKYEGNGLFRTASRASFDAVNDNYSPGDRVKARTTRPRSLNQNALLHAIIQNAFDNQRAGPHFANAEQLKGYLLVQIGYSDERRKSLDGMSRNLVTAFGKALAALSAIGPYERYFYDPKTGELVKRIPRRTRDADREKMSEIIEAVAAVIKEEIVPGVGIEELKVMAKASA